MTDKELDLNCDMHLLKKYGVLPGQSIPGLLKVTEIDGNGCGIEFECNGIKLRMNETQVGELYNLMGRIGYSIGLMSGTTARTVE